MFHRTTTERPTRCPYCTLESHRTTLIACSCGYLAAIIARYDAKAGA